MTILNFITRRNETMTAARQPRTTRPALEPMESRTMLSAVATFRVIDGNLYEKQGRHQTLVAKDVVSLESINRRTIMFAEQNGNVFEKTVSGPPVLIRHAAPTPLPAPDPNVGPSPSPSPIPGPAPTPAPSPDINDWFSENLSDPGIANLARAEYDRDGSITFADMEAIFDEVLQNGGGTSSQMRDLGTIVNSGASLNMPAYVQNLASKVINPTSADVSFVNWTYGGQGSALQELVEQWFQGTALPDAVDSCDGDPAADPQNMWTSAGSTGYTLFGPNGPSYADVQQGTAGDCWFLASLAETAARDTSAIKDMFIDNGNGTWTVRFFTNAGPDYITVNDQLPWDNQAQAPAFDTPVNGVLWVALAEKAFAEENLSGEVTTSDTGVASYTALNGGNPAWALAAITGLSASSYAMTQGASAATIAEDMEEGKLVCVITPQSGIAADLVTDHCYAVIGYNPSSSQPFEIFNPWGVNSFSQSGKWGLVYADASGLEGNWTSWGVAGSAASASGSTGPTVRASSAAPEETENSGVSAVGTSLETGSAPVIRITTMTKNQPSHSTSGYQTRSLPGGPLSRANVGCAFDGQFDEAGWAKTSLGRSARPSLAFQRSAFSGLPHAS
jgi:hypothetical protein